MAAARPDSEAAFRAFVRDVWTRDVAPLLRGRRAAQRARWARRTGRLACATGRFVDALLGLRGRPFGRSLTVLGSRLGALLPDLWDWDWLRRDATPAERTAVADRLQQRAAALPEADALALFGLTPSASRDEFRAAWRAVLLRWHPDRAPDEAARAEYHVRFVAYNAAHERLSLAYDEGRLPRPAG